MDMIMPWMSGFEAFVELGAIAVMKKPYRRQVLAELLSKYLCN